MRIFIAGATGVLGRRLLPMLVERGHDVVGMTRSREDLVRELGGQPVRANALDRDAVRQAVAEASPEVIMHQLTALTGAFTQRRFERAFGPTNRLRTEGTDNLLAAGRAAGVRRFIAQSYAGSGFPFERAGRAVKTEEAPLDSDPPASMRSTFEAIRHLEEAVLMTDEMEGIVLRYGGFYGPDTAFGPDGDAAERIRKRQFPIVGGGSGVWSFVHVDDAAAATVAAAERGQPGRYQIVDDDPAPVAEWLPVLAGALGAKPPLRVPRWLGRIVAGEAVVTMMTEARGASNAKAKRELDWKPRYSSWRTGFVEDPQT